MNDSRIIHNFDTLATTPLRRDAVSILEAGLAAIGTEAVLARNVKLRDNVLSVRNAHYDLASYERIFFIGIGKCAADAGVFFENLLGERITDGIILDVRGVPLKRLRCVVGSHPMPSRCNVEASEDVARLLDTATERDLVLTVISGGGSALLCLPNDMACEDLARVTECLMDAGAPIEELNTVRKHMSQIQGGQFARRAYPAQVVALLFSDVPGDDIATIASGPTVMDTTTQADAEAVLVRYDVRRVCGLPDCTPKETPKGAKYFERVDNILVLTNRTALEAMRTCALELGYDATIVETRLQGEARAIGRQLVVESSAPHTVRLYGGETTVTACSDGVCRGKGGRNQEVALAALAVLPPNMALASIASDGWDNTDAAGALVDSGLAKRAKEEGVDLMEALDRNASYDTFKQIGGHVLTGKTGSNVADIMMTITK